MIPGLGRSTGEGIGYPLQYSWASLVAQLVKNPPAMWDTWVQSLGWDDPLEKGKATHSSILAWRMLWTVYSPWGCKESDRTEGLSLHFTLLSDLKPVLCPVYYFSNYLKMFFNIAKLRKRNRGKIRTESERRDIIRARKGKADRGTK